MLATSGEGGRRLRWFLVRIFLSAVSIDSGAKLFDSLGRDMEFAVFDDYVS